MGDTTTVTFYRDGFFGYSNTQDFFIGSVWHFIPITIAIIIILLIHRYRKKIRKSKYEETIRYIMAFIMLMAEMSYFWRLLYVGSQGNASDMFGYLPLQMCQWGLILCVFTLLSKSKKLFSISFYITIGFAIIGVSYPMVILNTGPTYYRYYQFWFEHLLPIISLFYLMFVHKLKPEYKGIYKTIIAILPLAFICVLVNNSIPDANYLYLKLKVPVLPDNQIAKIPFLIIIVIGLFHLLYFIFNKCLNRKKKN